MNLQFTSEKLLVWRRRLAMSLFSQVTQAYSANQKQCYWYHHKLKNGGVSQHPLSRGLSYRIDWSFAFQDIKVFFYFLTQICKFWLKIGADYASVIGKVYVSFAFIKNKSSMSYNRMFVGRRWYTQAVWIFQ